MLPRGLIHRRRRTGGVRRGPHRGDRRSGKLPMLIVIMVRTSRVHGAEIAGLGCTGLLVIVAALVVLVSVG